MERRHSRRLSKYYTLMRTNIRIFLPSRLRKLSAGRAEQSFAACFASCPSPRRLKSCSRLLSFNFSPVTAFCVTYPSRVIFPVVLSRAFRYYLIHCDFFEANIQIHILPEVLGFYHFAFFA